MKTNKESLVTAAIVIVMMLSFALSAFAETSLLVKKREYEKTFSVTNSDILKTNNRYGNTTIQCGSDNEVKIKVVVEVKARNESKIQRTLDRIHIKMEKIGPVVNAITELDSDNQSFSNGESFSINYYITIPKMLTCDLSQKYGNINLPQNNVGKLTLNCKYGNISGGDFSNKLIIDSKYGNVDLGDVKQTNLQCKYGNVDISTLTSGEIGSQYGNVNISEVVSTLDMPDFAYGNLDIAKINSGFKTINIDARYGKVNLKAPSNLSFHLEVEKLKYGSCKVKGFDSLVRASQNANEYDSGSEDTSETILNINGGKGGRIYIDGNNYSNIRINGL